MSSLQSCGVSYPDKPNERISSLVAGLTLLLTLLAGLIIAGSASAEEASRTAVRKPIPTEQLLEQRSLSLKERIRQVTVVSNWITDDDNGTSESLELGQDESTDLLATDPVNETTKDADGESDESRRSRAMNNHLIELLKPIGDIDMRSGTEGRPVPENRAASVVGEGVPFFVTAMGYPVPPPDRYTICQTHRPLYFEQPNLERCGSGFGIFQNAFSGATFLANTIMLPYKVGKHWPDCEVPAGGDCKTCQSYPIDSDLVPIDRHGITMELAAIAGFTFLLL